MRDEVLAKVLASFLPVHTTTAFFVVVAVAGRARCALRHRVAIARAHATRDEEGLRRVWRGAGVE